MKKKLLAVLATAAICQPMLALEVMTVKLQNGDSILYSVDNVKEVTFGTNTTIVDESETPLKFKMLSDGTAEVIKDESYNTLKNVVIPSKILLGDHICTVSSIGDEAFTGVEDLTSVIIPETITNIGADAFSGSGVREIVIPGSVRTIGANAFNWTPFLESIEIKEGVTEIGSNAFSNCEKLTSIVIPEGITKISSNMFENSGNLTNVVLPESVTKIEAFAFQKCEKLNSINIPENVISIGKNAFYFCSSLTNVELPQSVSYIGENAFGSCQKLDLVINNTEENVALGKGAFDCKSVRYVVNASDVPLYFEIQSDTTVSVSKGDSLTIDSLKSIEIPSNVRIDGRIYSVTSIDAHAFMDYINLQSVVIPESVTTIGMSAFRGCSALASVNIPYGVTIINGATFLNCLKLTSLELPETVTEIEKLAFRGCANLDLSINNSRTNVTYYSSSFDDCKSVKFAE